MSEFFAMGGYAVYVWPSYAVAFGVMLGLLAWAWAAARQGEAAVERLRSAGLDPRRPGADRLEANRPDADRPNADRSEVAP